MNAIFDPIYSSTVGAWGLIVSVLGLVLTVAGFVISIQQIKKTKLSADAATDAIKAVQVRISQYDTAVDLAEAKNSLNSARNYADLEAWPQFVASYESASEALGRIALQSFDSNPELSENIKKSKARIAKLCNQVEKFLENGGKNPQKFLINKAIRIELSIIQEAEQHNWKEAIS